MPSALTYRPDSTAMIIGVGLMGQHMAEHALQWLPIKKLVLVDSQDAIRVGRDATTLTAYADDLTQRSGAGVQIAAEAVDVADEGAVRALFARHPGIDYWQHTAGISLQPLTPPERVTKEAVLKSCEVNLWGVHNVIKQGVNAQAFARGARGVIILSTSATVGSEGRASSAYEESKGGLLNLLRLQARYFVEQHHVVLNGIAPSPLRGPMAAQNETAAGRLQAVEKAMPMGGLTEPKHISAATMFFWAEECWAAGEVLTIDGGYTKHRPIYGPLS